MYSVLQTESVYIWNIFYGALLTLPLWDGVRLIQLGAIIIVEALNEDLLEINIEQKCERLVGEPPPENDGI